MAGGVGVAAAQEGTIGLDIAAHPPFVRQGHLAVQQPGDPAGLQLRQGHDRPEGLDQPQEEQVGQFRIDHPPVKVYPVVLHRKHFRLQKRKGDVIAGGINDRIERFTAAVDEPHPFPLQFADIRFDLDPPVSHVGQKFLIQSGMLLQQFVAGPGQAVALLVTNGHVGQYPEGGAAQGQRKIIEQRMEPLIIGNSQHIFRKHIGAAPGRKMHRAGQAGEVDRNIAGGISDPDDQHIFVFKGLGRFIMMRMDCFSVKASGKFRPAGIPVMAVGHHHRTIVPALAPCEGHLPAIPGVRRHLFHFAMKADGLANAKVIDIILEITQYIAVMAVVGKIFRHGIIGILHVPLAGDDMQGAVGGRHPVVVSVAPVAADTGTFLKAVKINSLLPEGFRGGNTGGAGADDTGGFHLTDTPLL